MCSIVFSKWSHQKCLSDTNRSCLPQSLRISAKRMLHVLLRFALVGLRQRTTFLLQRVETLKHIDRNVCFKTCFNPLKQPVPSYIFLHLLTIMLRFKLHCLHCPLHCQMSRLHEELLNFNPTQMNTTEVNKSDKSDIEVSRSVQIA